MGENLFKLAFKKVSRKKVLDKNTWANRNDIDIDFLIDQVAKICPDILDEIEKEVMDMGLPRDRAVALYIQSAWMSGFEYGWRTHIQYRTDRDEEKIKEVFGGGKTLG